MADHAGARQPRRVTLADVAQEAGVSRALVSIVMRDVAGASPATRERVMTAANALGYRPDVRARALAGQGSKLIGVMFGVTGTFHLDLLDGLYAAAEDAGYGLILSALTPGRDEARAVQSLQDFGFDALVMLEPPTPMPLMAGELPLVVVGWHVDHPDVDSVRTSDEHGMSLAVGHLSGLGHRRIVHVDGGDTPTGVHRREAYVAAMRAAGLEREIAVLPGGVSQLEGQRAARRLLDEQDLPTAVIGYNDDVAVGALGVLALHGVDIPGRVSLLGWDDNAIARLSPTQLTTVAQQPREMARLGVERLIARINGEAVVEPDIVLEPELVVRATTAAPAS
jgi:DNA-binding LacI/PurR family transcriptional regulator